MYCFGSCGLRCRDDLLDGKIRLARGGRSDADGLVREAHMSGLCVGLREDGNRPNSHQAGRLDDAAGDLATISDQYLIEHFDVLSYRPTRQSLIQKSGETLSSFI